LQRLHAALSDEEVRHARLAQEELLYEFASREKALLEERRLKEEAMFSTTTAIKNLRNKGDECPLKLFRFLILLRRK